MTSNHDFVQSTLQHLKRTRAQAASASDGESSEDGATSTRRPVPSLNTYGTS